MINLFTGTPGSGKSLDMARFIFSFNRQKKPVICNFEIDKKKLKYPDLFFFVDNIDLTVDYLVDFAKNYYNDGKVKESSIILVVDECQMMFNSRDWSKPDRQAWNKFFQIHRHYGFDIYLVTQFDSMIDKQIRSLVEYNYIHRKVKNFGLKGYFLSVLFLAPSLFVSIKYWYPMKEKISSEFFRGRKKLYSLYNTFDLSSK